MWSSLNKSLLVIPLIISAKNPTRAIFLRITSPPDLHRYGVWSEVSILNSLTERLVNIRPLFICLRLHSEHTILLLNLASGVEKETKDKQVGHDVEGSDAEEHIWIIKWNLLADLHHDKHDHEVRNCRIHFFRFLSTLLYRRRRVQLFGGCRTGGEHRSPRKKNFTPA